MNEQNLFNDGNQNLDNNNQNFDNNQNNSSENCNQTTDNNNISKTITDIKEKALQIKNKINLNGEKDKQKSTIKLIVFVFVIFILVLLFNKLTKKQIVDYKAVPSVNVTYLYNGDIAKDISVMGNILPNDTYYVVSKVAGDIKKIHVKNGDHVKKGDLICEIDASKEIEAAFIQYDASRKNYERMEKLYKAGDISLQSFETVKAQYDANKLAYDTKIEYAYPVAPADGIIDNIDMVVNTTIATGKVLCYISSKDAKEVNFGVTERVLNGIGLGDKIVIEKGGKTYDGYISDIANMTNPSTGQFDVKATITSPNNFASGVNAKVTFIYQRKNDVNLLPNDLIYHENGNAFVYVVDEESVVRKKYIETGMENQDICEIVSGIDEDDKIISTWNTDLADGAVVNVVKEEKLELNTVEIDDLTESERQEIIDSIEKDIEEGMFSITDEEMLEIEIDEELPNKLIGPNSNEFINEFLEEESNKNNDEILEDELFGFEYYDGEEETTNEETTEEETEIVEGESEKYKIEEDGYRYFNFDEYELDNDIEETTTSDNDSNLETETETETKDTETIDNNDYNTEENSLETTSSNKYSEEQLDEIIKFYEENKSNNMEVE